MVFWNTMVLCLEEEMLKKELRKALKDWGDYIIRYMEDMEMVWEQDKIDYLSGEVARLGALYERSKNEKGKCPQCGSELQKKSRNDVSLLP